MKNIFLCLLGILTLVGQAEANRTKYWPGYIDNSDCAASTDCGFGVNIFANGGVFWSGEIPEVTTTSIRLLGNDGTGADSTHATRPFFALRLLELAVNQNQGTEEKYGVYLKDGKGNDTSYRLKGFRSSPEIAIKIRAHLCRVEKKNAINSCVEDTRYVDYEYTLSDLKSGTYKGPYKLNNWEAVKWVEVWMQNNDFRLASNSDGYNVRSLHLPAVYIDSRYTTYNRDGGVISDANIGGQAPTGSRYLLLDKIVRLNHRQCKLSLTPDTPVNFGNLSVTDDQVGQIGTTRETRIDLSCDGRYTENLFTGGTVGDPNVNVEKTTDISGQNAVHVVEEMKITANSPVSINGIQQIGLTLQQANTQSKDANQPVANPYMYVVGSLSKTGGCDVSSLPINQDIKDIASKIKTFEDGNKNDKDYSIAPLHLNTLYWKLCKTKGEVEGGKYKGTATISIKYK